MLPQRSHVRCSHASFENQPCVTSIHQDEVYMEIGEM